ncbi:hypothetical protein TIFTF001_030714 [Ficus carica]|uniref:Uncharacterized protein n=1 Tax=Ficus carica TaxID=3494 RepID=A0AA88DYI6_FICCA|nr:hypothetical protein TIFTF001_030714 [Ficus carica]
MMLPINVKKTTIVKPAEKTPRQVIPLTNVDLVTKPEHNPCYYIFKNTGAHQNFFDAEVLKDALRKVLVPFYPMAGRFRSDNNGRPEIDCNEEGVLFIEAETTNVLDDLGDFAPLEKRTKKLVPTVDLSGGISSFPFLVVQVTNFKCGGVSLGFGIHHFVVDGYSAFQFMDTWADFARGRGLAIPPYFDRTLLRSGNLPQSVPNRPEYQLQAPDKNATPQNTKFHESGDKTESVKVSILRVTKEQLHMLKEKAKELYEDGNAFNYSTFEVLSAHIWKCACIARATPDKEETKLSYPVSGRFSRLQPPLPDGYFGNAIFRGLSTAVVGHLKSKPLSYAANKSHETLVRMDNDYIRSTIDYVEQQSQILTARYGPHIHKSPNLAIISWVKFPTHDIDFGWGRTLHMVPGDLRFEGQAYICRNAENDGSLRIAIALQSSHMKVFEELFFTDCMVSQPK